jgi:hypothetical protein
MRASCGHLSLLPGVMPVAHGVRRRSLEGVVVDLAGVLPSDLPGLVTHPGNHEPEIAQYARIFVSRIRTSGGGGPNIVLTRFLSVA